MAEGRGKAQAAALRADAHRDDGASAACRRHRGSGAGHRTAARRPVRGRGRTRSIPGDGEVVEGVASVDESAITGESAPVIRESGGDRSAVTGGTKVLSDRIVVEITSKPGETFIDRMIALVEGAQRQKTPNEIALNILLASLTIVFLLATVTLQPFAIYSGAEQTVVVLVALLVCLIPTTIGALLSAIGIAGMDRLVQRNVLAMSGRAVEAAGDVEHAAPRQDRHDHARQPPGRGVHPRARRDGRRPRRMRRRSRASPTRRPRAVRSWCSRRSSYGLRGRDVEGSGVRPLHRADPDERGRRRRPPAAQGRGRLRPSLGRGARRFGLRGGRHDRGRHRGPGRHAAHRRRERPGARRDLPEGHREGGHAPAVRRAAADGDPHGDDHRRQPADRRGDRGRGRRRRLPRRGHARGQDGADPAASSRAASSSR